MAPSFQEKKDFVIKLFASCTDNEEKYNKIIELGKKVPPLPKKLKQRENQVKGCQSLTYLHTINREEKLYFQAESEALISSGLAFLLTSVYSGEKPELLFQNPPKYLEKLNLPSLLTPTRINGLYSIYFHMQKQALKFLAKKLPK